MKRFLKLSVILGLMVGLCSGLYPNGFNLNSNGSKAIAMGGAFVGLADDYSAVFWNPAGLTQMTKTTLSFSVPILFPLQGTSLVYQDYSTSTPKQKPNTIFPVVSVFSNLSRIRWL